MNVTLFSVITSILLFNVYIIVIAYMRQNNGFLMRFSIIPLVLLIVCGILRLISFVEVPNATVIGSYDLFPTVLDFLRMRLYTVNSTGITIYVYHILITIWITGSIYYLVKYILQSFKLYKSVNVIPAISDIRIITCMNNILAESNKNAKVKIIQSETIRVPIITGFVKPIICLPYMQFSDDELKSILLHEWTHFLNKHAWVKLSMYIICSIFWWNPFVHILKRELNHILEIQCDLSITSKIDEEARINYLKSILKVVKVVSKNNLPYESPMNSAALVSTNKTQKIDQRFRLVLDYDLDTKQNIFPLICICMVILIVFFASYKVVIQPRTLSTAEAGYEDTFSITPENSYLTLNEDGTYSLYADGIYRCDVPTKDIEPFSLLPIK